RGFLVPVSPAGGRTVGGGTTAGVTTVEATTFEATTVEVTAGGRWFFVLAFVAIPLRPFGFALERRRPRRQHGRPRADPAAHRGRTRPARTGSRGQKGRQTMPPRRRRAHRHHTFGVALLGDRGVRAQRVGGRRHFGGRRRAGVRYRAGFRRRRGMRRTGRA